jgi:hypothetical protein
VLLFVLTIPQGEDDKLLVLEIFPYDFLLNGMRINQNQELTYKTLYKKGTLITERNKWLLQIEFDSCYFES